MVKKILIGLAVLVVIVGGGVYLLLDNLNDIVRAAIEKIGSDMTQTDVVLDEVDIELVSGRGALRGFRVTNPRGFSDHDSFRFDEVRIRIDITSIGSDPVIIKEIVIQSPEIVYEFGKDGANNLDQLNQTVQSKAGDGGGSGQDDVPNFVVRNLYMRDGRIAVVVPAVNEKVSLPLPLVHLRDIGTESEGARPEAIFREVLAEVLQSARGAVARAPINIGRFTGAAARTAEQAIENATGAAVDQAAGTVDSIVKGVGDVGKEAGDAVRGLLKSIGR